MGDEWSDALLVATRAALGFTGKGGMKLFYCKTPTPNFGDELNPWMWSRLLPDFFDGDERELFLGIGSILFDYFPTTSTKIVFGAGYGGYTAPPTIDANWKIYFVRGKRTADQLGLDHSLALGDAAILLRSCVAVGAIKQYKVSFMPHWESAIYGDWQAVCSAAGIHYIDPTAMVETVLNDILTSELVISEAMHGAIAADALRVPWIALQPVRGYNRMKWLDWASALDIELRPHALPASNAFEMASSWVSESQRWVQRLERRAAKLRHPARNFFVARAAKKLSRIARSSPQLSSDAAMQRAHGGMLEKLDELRRDVSATFSSTTLRKVAMPAG